MQISTNTAEHSEINDNNNRKDLTKYTKFCSSIVNRVDVVFIVIIFHWLHKTKPCLSFNINLNINNAIEFLKGRLNRIQSKQPTKIPHFTFHLVDQKN